MSIESAAREVPCTQDDCSQRCKDTSTQIRGYLEAVGNAYRGKLEQMGTFILNVFEQWVHTDKCAAVVYPLLLEYYPYFEPEMLDVLLLSRLEDMRHLQAIQQYLHGRSNRAKKRITIFANPQGCCFAARCFEDTENFDDDQAARLARPMRIPMQRY